MARQVQAYLVDGPLANRLAVVPYECTEVVITYDRGEGVQRARYVPAASGALPGEWPFTYTGDIVPPAEPEGVQGGS